MSCCSTPQKPSDVACPRCESAGQRVKPTTLEFLLRPSFPTQDERHRFCATIDCGVLWYGENSGHVLPISACTVAVGQKSTEPSRAICYCFGFSASDLLDDQHEHGESRIKAEIVRRCREKAQNCERTNPQGRCCLGNVSAVLRT